VWTQTRGVHATGNQIPPPPNAGTFNSRFNDWQVCWLGGWPRDRLSYLVMVVRVPC